MAKLREFWELVSRPPFGFDGDLGPLLARGDAARAFAQPMSAITATMLGVPGLYAPRIPSVLFQPPGTLEATSFYDTTLLKVTLERLVDFDLINSESQDVRLSLGSVNARSGQLVYFDSTTDIIRAEHVMASGALPPWFAAVEIDGEYYWDGGVVSNTPLEWLARHRLPDTLAFNSSCSTESTSWTTSCPARWQTVPFASWICRGDRGSPWGQPHPPTSPDRI